MSTSSSSERLASVCIYTEKKNRKRALFFCIVFAHAEENRHALVYEYVYSRSLSVSLLPPHRHANRSRCTDIKKRKKRRGKKGVEPRVNSP